MANKKWDFTIEIVTNKKSYGPNSSWQLSLKEQLKKPANFYEVNLNGRQLSFWKEQRSVE